MLTRYMDGRTDGHSDSYIPPPKLCLWGGGGGGIIKSSHLLPPFLSLLAI